MWQKVFSESAYVNTYFVFLLLVFLGVGFFGAIYYVQHEPQFAKHQYSTAEILRTRALSHRLRNLEYYNAHLESEIAELKLQKNQRYEAVFFTPPTDLARFVGMIPQEGPGIRMIVKDSSRPLLVGENPNNGIVHNTDLVQLVNELRAAGALAITINDQPIANDTAITCSGPIIIINGTRVSSPFKLDALGNSKQMLRRLNQPDSFVKELKKFNIEVTMAPRHVRIPAYSQEAADASLSYH